MGITFIGGTPAPTPNDVGSYLSGPSVGGFGNLINVRVITTTQTYNSTAGTNSIIAYGQAGGGGGGGMPASNGTTQYGSSQAGGSGGLFVHRMTSGFNGLTATVGVGGNGGAAGANNGQVGGVTTFSTASATGGTGGLTGPLITTGASNSAGPAGAGASGGNILNQQGYAALQTDYNLSINMAILGIGGSTIFGPGGNSSVNNAGFNGPAPGSGGGGVTQTTAGTTARAGGNGAAGIIIIYEYA